MVTTVKMGFLIKVIKGKILLEETMAKIIKIISGDRKWKISQKMREISSKIALKSYPNLIKKMIRTFNSKVLEC